MRSPADELARRLAREAQAVCRHYLSNGRRAGRYWLVGDVANTPGRSLFVRLTGPDSGKGAAGKWTDAATGEHGDLLDLIARNRRLDRVRDVLDEARSFLRLPRKEYPSDRSAQQPSAPTRSPESARRLFANSRPIAGTIAEAYLRRRGITALHDNTGLRFHPRCYYRSDGDGLIDRATEVGIEAISLSPKLEDFNEDLRKTLGIDALVAAIRVGIAPEDVARFMELPVKTGTEK
jgi:hypothetical protein